MLTALAVVCRRISFVLFLTSAVFLARIPLHAQQLENLPQVGEKASVTYQQTDVDSVDLTTGNVFVHIPLVSFPQKGNKLRLNFFVRYNEPQWIAALATPTVNFSGGFSSTGSWKYNSFGVPRPVGVNVVRDQGVTGINDITEHSANGAQGTTVTYFSTVDGIRDRTDAEHYLSYQSGVANGPSSFISTPSADGAGWMWANTQQTQVRDRDGLLYSLVAFAGIPSGFSAWNISDAHGNTIQTNTNGWIDSAGRSIPGSWTGVGGLSGEDDPVPGVASNETSRCGAGTVATRTWTVPASSDSGGSQTYYFCYAQYTGTTAFHTTSADGGNVAVVLDEAQFSEVLLSQIILPNDTYYGFKYDPHFLDITGIHLPGGGSISYQWETIPWDTCTLSLPVKRAVMQRTEDPGSGNPVSVWKYNWATNGICSTDSYVSLNGVIVTKPDGSDEWHHENATANYTTDVDYFQGASSGGPLQATGILLKRVQTTIPMNPSIYFFSQADHIAYDDATQSEIWTNSGTGVQKYFPGPPTKVVTTLYDPVSQQILNSQEVDSTPIPSDGSFPVFDTGNYYGPQLGTCACHNYSEVQSTGVHDFVIGSGSGPGPLLQQTTTQYEFQTSGGQAYANLGMTDLPSSVSVGDGQSTLSSTTYAYDESAYSSGATAGEMTTQSQSLTGGSSITTHTKYNSSGVLAGTIDAKGATTAVNSYDCSGLFPSKFTLASGTSVAETVTYTHDCNTGSIISYKDANSQTTSFTYADPLNRITSTSKPDGGNVTVSYNGDPTPPVTTITTALGNGNSPMIQNISYDGLGRTTQTSLTSDPSGTDLVDTTYDLLGRVQSTSNPYRSKTESTYGLTSYAYDALGRMTLQCQPDNGTGSNPCAAGSSYLQWVYTGNVVDSYDETRRHSQRTTDGLGRLTKVLEPDGGTNVTAAPSLETDYAYDALNNLTQVNQHGLVRSFTYDSLSRLITASNPETGTTCYGTWSGGSVGSGTCQNGYDANGNLIAKTDARNITTTYSYDSLNRLTAKTYSDSTPPSHYNYDETSVTVGNNFWSGPWTIANGIGRLTSQYVGTSAPGLAMKSFTYDAMGRPLQSWQCWGALECGSPYGTRALSQSYDLAGNITSLNNSADASVLYTYDRAGRMQTAQYQYGPASAPQYIPLVTSETYTPAGQPSGRNGNETWGYDNRMRLTSYVSKSSPNSSTVNYGYSLTYDHNGNVTFYSPEFGSVAWTSSYSYDNLNRLSTVITPGTGTGCLETYDTFGNRTSQQAYGASSYQCVASALSFTGNGAGNNNRVDGYCYDAAGNLLDDGPCPAGSNHKFTYDAEGRIATALNGQITNVYGADGLKVTSQIGSSATNYVYDYSGNIVAYYFANQPHDQPIWINGKHFGTMAPGPALTLSITDWLGSDAVRTDPAGNLQAAFCSLPFGDGLTACLGADPLPSDPTHFTGKERDTNTNLDYFGARYYASSMGRWMSPDSLNLTDDRLLNPANTFNKYIYGGNNPLKYVDLDGHDITVFYERGNVSLGNFSPGHIMFAANNPTSGQSAVMSFGPAERDFFTVFGGDESTKTYGLPMTPDDLRNNYASITIQTSPEDAQKVIEYIKQLSASSTPYAAFTNDVAQNCSTVCREALKIIGILPSGDKTFTPSGLWEEIYKSQVPGPYNANSGLYDPHNGRDYGHPQYGMSPFVFFSPLFGGNSGVTVQQGAGLADPCTATPKPAGCS